ncbi:MAG: organic hydroperoxide resistance protein [Pseudomonadota bacterium]
MSVNVLYTTSATATGGRDGHARTEAGKFEVRLGTPKELGGNDRGNNPEQLFAAGYAACFLGAMKFVASQGNHAKVPADASVSSTVGIGPRADKGFGLKVSLVISLPGVEGEAAERLVAEADTICPYSHAVRGNVEVDIKVA